MARTCVSVASGVRNAGAPALPPAHLGSEVSWRVVVVAGDPSDGERVRNAIDRAGSSADVYYAGSLPDAIDLSARVTIDVLLLDLRSGAPGSSLAIAEWTQRVPDVPIIVVADADDDAVTLSALRAGAQDCLTRAACLGDQPQQLLRALRYAAERHRAIGSLRDACRLRSTFVTAASHELRTPITIIRDYAWLLSDGTTGPLAPAQAECVEAIMRNCTRLGALVRDLFDTARMEAGTLTLSPEPTTVATLLIRCYNDFLACCDSKSQHLELHLDGELGCVICDRDRLTQVIVNLLANAHRFTPAGGVIALRGSLDGGEVRITVADSGIGIPLADQSRIFDAFVQLDRRSAAGPQGTGLGLYIARRLVHLQGGTLTVCSSPGEGSAFTVALPMPPQTFAPERLASAIAALTDGRAPASASASLVWLHAGSVPFAELERTVNALFRRHDTAYRFAQPAALACLIEGGDADARGYLRRLQRALRPHGGSVHYRIEPLPHAPAGALVPPPLATMRALTLCPPADNADSMPQLRSPGTPC